VEKYSTLLFMTFMENFGILEYLNQTCIRITSSYAPTSLLRT
jgi:hypothetical protein